MKNFQFSEFSCPCCGQNKMEPVFLAMIDDLREQFGAPLHVNSGYRCEKHNAEVGGKPHSMHLTGKAADISTVNMTNEQRHEFMMIVKAMFKGIGVGKTFTHMDMRQTPAFWVY
jgi:uncharacterized protein YcbK (DUF882 family)